MKIKYSGSFEQLQELLLSLDIDGGWFEPSENQNQYRCSNGAILNYYQSTGTLLFQGPTQYRQELKDKVLTAIKNTQQEQNTESKKYHTASASVMGPNTSVFGSTELYIGLVGAVGTELDSIEKEIQNTLSQYSYQYHTIKVSDDVIKPLSSHFKIPLIDTSFNERVVSYMDAGDEIRKRTKRNDILAIGAANNVNTIRGDKSHLYNTAFIIRSLKHPDEVQKLREIYSSGFYLIGVYQGLEERKRNLTVHKHLSDSQTNNLIERDEDEKIDYGQKTSDTFHLSDFFINMSDSTERLKNDIKRIVELIFGNPFLTPTFDEYAMYMSFAASLRSADLSRQVGAVIAKDKEIIATGANDVPRFGGGQYWPEYIYKNVDDIENGRDYKKGYDSNQVERDAIIEDIANKILKNSLADKTSKEEIIDTIKRSKLKDITEYGRAVHAEMSAILSCAKNGIPLKEAELYCTTFPCHNCAKHIVGSGIKRVIFIEPYPKSKALDLHGDSIVYGMVAKNDKVQFEPFVGVGPRRFFDLFSISLGGGQALIRKDKTTGKIANWKNETAKVRIQLLPQSYLEREQQAAETLEESIKSGEINYG